MAIVPDVCILFEQGPCLALHKPGGILTQSAPGIDSLEIRIKAFLKQRDQLPGRVYLGVPHRLDRPSSGVLVVARHQRAARRLSEQFQGRTVEKRYWAIMEGQMEKPEGRWIDWLRKTPGTAHVEVVPKGTPGSREARLGYRVISQAAQFCCVEIQLETGRTHQIRVQSASRGHPLLGDFQYGASQPFGPESENPRSRWIALHAHQLRFRHPVSWEKIEVNAPLPAPWKALGSGLDL